MFVINKFNLLKIKIFFIICISCFTFNAKAQKTENDLIINEFTTLKKALSSIKVKNQKIKFSNTNINFPKEDDSLYLNQDLFLKKKNKEIKIIFNNVELTSSLKWNDNDFNLKSLLSIEYKEKNIMFSLLRIKLFKLEFQQIFLKLLFSMKRNGFYVNPF